MPRSEVGESDRQADLLAAYMETDMPHYLLDAREATAVLRMDSRTLVRWASRPGSRAPYGRSWYDETNGTRTYRKRTIGTVVRYPHLRDAEKTADAFATPSTPSSECRKPSLNSLPTTAKTS
jgi:hypothetical protein